MARINNKAKVIWLVGTKHANDKVYTPLNERWHWNRKECAAYCKSMKANPLYSNSDSKHQPMKFVYAGNIASLK